MNQPAPMSESTLRIARFTSSNIHKLMTTAKNGIDFGAPALTYIAEKNLERKLGRSLDTEVSTRAITWGNFLEERVHGLVDFDYQLVSKQTFTHPTIPYWAGSPDLIAPKKKVGEIKCYQPKKFAQYSDALLSKDIERIRKDFNEEYWQVVSNCIIQGLPNAELICYMPYKSELEDIRDAAANYDAFDQFKYKFIVDAEDSELAYLPDGGYYKNINRFEFEVPQGDKDLLTANVLRAGSMLDVTF